MAVSLLPSSVLAARRFTDDAPIAEIPAETGESAERPADPAEFVGPSADLEAVGPRTYYVSTGGKGGNSGLSQEKPLPGLDAVPWSQLFPGDQVLLKKGETFPGTIRMVDVHGTADEPIVIGAYGTGAAPVIEARGQGIWLPETGNGNGSTPGKYVSSGVTLYDCSYVTVKDLTIKNVPNAMKSSYLCWDGATSYETDDSAKLTYSGIGVAADDVGACEGITLTNITVQLGKGLPNPTMAVKTDTSTAINTAGVTTGAAADPRAFKNAAGTYYVSSLTGSDANNGTTRETPFYSLHKINELNLQPGAKVYLEYGSVFENQYLHIEGGGDATKVVEVNAYGVEGKGKPQINTNGNGVWYQNYRKNLDNASHLTHGWVSSSILLYDVPYVEIKNIAVTNFGRYGETPGADFANLGSYDGGTVPGETGYGGSGNGAGNKIGCYQWGGKMCRTGVAAVAQNKGTVTHTVLQNLDIENVYGQIVYKHMNNGGIYFTVARPTNENTTGIARFDDVVIEGCYLKHVSRWGIAVAHTSYWQEISPNGQKTVPDAACRKYGATNVYVGRNYLEEVGGDSITLMHAYEPFVEYNVSYNGGREMGNSTTAPRYMNNSSFGNYKGDVSAGIWPWKCKTALFEHNECYTMLYSHLGANNDAQPWDADSGDSTIYQYNYSSGNTGACIMFCGGDAYNTVFRYNISYKDGMPWNLSNPQNGDNRRGILDPSSSPNGQIYNNTFVVAEGTPVYHYTTSSPHKVENNIFYNLGNDYAPEGGWNAASGLKFAKNIYVGFAQTGDGSYTAKDTDPITLTKSDALFAGDVSTAPTAPKTTSKSGAKLVNGVRDWTHNWATEFYMFKLDAGATRAINAGLEHDYDCLTQDSDFGVPRVANDKDFYGNALDNVHDIGAFDTRTADPVTGSSNACELVESLYEVRDTDKLQVPFGANFPLTAEKLLKGLTVSEKATVAVYQADGTTAVSASGHVAAGMKVKITAENGTDNKVYTIANKNAYNAQTDWVDDQQGNVWFYQAESNGVFNNHSSMGTDWKDWTGGGGSVEQNQAVGNVYSTAGSGFTFRAPVSGTVQVSFGYKAANDNAGKASTSGFVTGSIRKREAHNGTNQWQTYMRSYLNGEEQADKAVRIPMDSVTAIPVTPYTVTVAQGDTLSFMVRNEEKNESGTLFTNYGVYFTPIITYQNVTFTEPEDKKAPSTPVGLRTSALTDTTATLAWEPSTDNVGVTGYKVKVGNGAEVTVNATTKELTGLTANTAYTVTVKAVDAAGNESGAASITFTTAKTPDTTAPTQPGAGSAATTATTATISWGASTDNVGVDHYRVTIGGKTLEVRNATKVTVTGLAVDTTYSATVVAVDAAGNESTARTISNIKTQATATAPAKPAEVEAVDVTKSQAVARWTHVDAAAGYRVKLDNGESVDVGNRLQYTFTGLTPATTYTVSVCAYGEADAASGWTQVEFTTAGSSECALISSLYQMPDATKFQVPYTEQNPLTAADFAAGLTISPDAHVEVYYGETKLADTDNVAGGMTVKIVAQDHTVNPTVYTLVEKITYDSFLDWVGNQTQGNVWFYQYEDAGKFVNHTSWSSTYSCWAAADGSGAYSVEKNQACGSIKTPERGSGYTFRAPANGMAKISLNYYDGTTLVENKVHKRHATDGSEVKTYLRVYRNGEALPDKEYLLANGSTDPINVPAMTMSLKQGDEISFMVRNEGDLSTKGANHGVYFTPRIEYLNQRYVPEPDSIELNETEATIYTNTSNLPGIPRTLQLTANVLPEEASQTVTWSSTRPEFATVNTSGLVTAVADGTTAITATVTTSMGTAVTASCTVHVSTRVESITVKNGAETVGQTPIKLYTNTSLGNGYPHAVTLTGETVPAQVTHPALNWTRVGGPQGRVTITDRTENSKNVTITATTDILNVGEVKMEVASAEHPEVKTGFTIHVIRQLANDVHVTGTLKVGETLTASTVELEMTDEGKAKLAYQWYRGAVDEANKIDGATRKQYVVTAADVGETLSVAVTADPTTFYEGTRTAQAAAAVVKMAGPEAPVGLGVVNCTGGDNGQITGLNADTAYEYKREDGDTWTSTAADATTIDDLAAGTYLVRVKVANAATQEEGKSVKLVIITADDAATVFTITVDPAVTGGTIDVVNQAEAGTQVTVTADPAEGFELTADSLTVTYTDDLGAAQTVTVTGGTFTMPVADVTVKATFAKKTFKIIHELTNIQCTLGAEHEHTVEYGETPTVTLTAKTGYTMPTNAPTMVTKSGKAFYGFVYSRSATNPDTATLTFTEGITEDLTVTANAPEKTLVVNYTLKDGLSAPEDEAPRSVIYGKAYRGTLVADDPAEFDLPTGITITMDGAAFTDFTYNAQTGVIDIIAGKITGNLIITAFGRDVTVDVVPVLGVSLNRTSATVAIGNELTLTATVRPGNATDGLVVWTSSDPEVATVDAETGKVTGVAEGTATITATTRDGGHTATCAVTVVKAAAPSPGPGGSTTPAETTTTETRDDGAKVTTVTKPDGSKVETVEQADGSKTEAITSKDGDVTITAVDKDGEELAKVEIPATIPEPETKFEDLDTVPWAEEAVNNVAALELVKGTGGNKYTPTAPMTRGSLATVLHRLSQGKSDYQNTFKDVAAGKYYTEGVAWAAKANVVKGISEDVFAPDDIITREQLAVMLARYAKLIGMDTKADSHRLNAFADGDATGDWAVDGVAWCVANGILKGKGQNNLDPTAEVSRAEVAVMLDRFIALIQK